MTCIRAMLENMNLPFFFFLLFLFSYATADPLFPAILTTAALRDVQSGENKGSSLVDPIPHTLP